jgi:ABC-type transporter MlaC component
LATEHARRLYKISDVIIDGVSMEVSERSEFASVIQRSGG